MTSNKHPRTGFTLLELLVVLSILVALAALILPKVTDIFERSRSATQAYSLSDVTRHLETYSALNHKYPDGWDTLMASPDDSATYSRLAPELEAPNTFFTTADLTDDQITSLGTAGIHHAFLHDETLPGSEASNSGTDRRHFGDGQGHDGTENIRRFVVVDKTVAVDGQLSDGMDLLVNSFGLNSNRSADDTTFPRINAHTYVVLGLGPKSTMVQSQIHEAPILEHTTSSSNYSRALAVFELPNTGTKKARLVGVLGPDGRSKSTSISDYNSEVAQSHNYNGRGATGPGTQLPAPYRS